MNRTELKDTIYYPINMQNIGEGKKCFVRTYGCQSNVRDSEIILGILQTLGYEPVNHPEIADIIILNTCAIRENAEKKVFGEIGFLKKLKIDNPDIIFGVCGCMMQNPLIVRHIQKSFKHVELIFGTHNLHKLPEYLEQVLFEKQASTEIWNRTESIQELLPSVRQSKISAFVNIMYGCNNFCTYCIVPSTRGKQISRKKNDILNEVESLINQGYQEITLLGQNVNSWGLDLDPKDTFAELLDAVAKCNVPRLRFQTSNPWDFSDEIINIVAKHKNIMPAIHLPLQSGDDNVLVEMNRNHDSKFYKELVNRIKSKIPHIALSTDIIVGFPNESNEQFEKTLEMYDFCKYVNAYTFIYSKRSGTHAAILEDLTDMKEKQERLAKLNTYVKKYAKEDSITFLNKIVDVLVEGYSKKDQTKLTGYTPERKLVNFIGDPKSIGKIVKVKINDAKIFTLNGKQV